MYGHPRPEEAAAHGEDRRGAARRAGPGAHHRGGRAGLPAHPGERPGRARAALLATGAAAHRPAGGLLAETPGAPAPTPMLVGYARVSTIEQTLALQQEALTKAGCQRLFTNTASGSHVVRPGLDEALDFLHPGGLAAGPAGPLAAPPPRHRRRLSPSGARDRLSVSAGAD